VAEIEFKSFGKIPRYENETYTITEKIDGTNGCIIIPEDGEIYAQSKNRIITPEDDNMGFAKWVQDHKEELQLLGPGRHFGEWWGPGIQRRYFENFKVFSLFAWWLKPEEIPSCCRKVPVIAHTIEQATERLQTEGSIASPGFLNPEGFIVTSNLHRRILYKVILNETDKGDSRG
jgi:hypothetical protein